MMYKFNCNGNEGKRVDIASPRILQRVIPIKSGIITIVTMLIYMLITYTNKSIYKLSMLQLVGAAITVYALVITYNIIRTRIDRITSIKIDNTGITLLGIRDKVLCEVEVEKLVLVPVEDKKKVSVVTELFHVNIPMQIGLETDGHLTLLPLVVEKEKVSQLK